MNLKRKIDKLLNYGLHENFVFSLNESKIDSLYERISKKETSEAVQKIQTTSYLVPSADVSDNKKTAIPDKNISITKDKSGNIIVGETEEIDEKFESKSQQGYFWARCNECESKNCKWCKMAKEFSKSTSKKDYENMPYKKEQSEGYQEALISTYAKGIANNMNKSLINPKFSNESMFQNKLEQIIEKNLKPTMRKQDLTNLINRTMNRRLNEMFADPIEKIKTGTETEYELELEKNYDYAYTVFVCGGKEKRNISTENPLEIDKIYHLKNNECVRVFEETNSGTETDINPTVYDSCPDCQEAADKAKVKEKEKNSNASYGLSSDDKSGSGRTKRGVKQITGPIQTPYKNTDPLELPKADKEGEKLIQQLKRDFDKKSEKLKEIYNRRFK